MNWMLDIRSIPIEFEFKVTPAQLHMRSQVPSAAIQRQKGDFQVTHKPARLRLDFYDARSSMGLKTVSDFIREYRDLGVQAALDATGNIVEEGNQLMDTRSGDQVMGEIAFQRMQTQMDSGLAFLPSMPVSIDWEPHDLSVQYEMDKLHFDWKVHAWPQMEYTPGELEYSIKEYPRLEITYLGRPVYVPPSADPEYQPEPYDVLA